MKISTRCALMLFFTLVLSVQGLFAQVDTVARVTTDKPDYAPLSQAVFTGSGFKPGELVELKVKNLFQPCNTVNPDSSYMPWTVTANSSGGFVTNWTVCNCPGDSLRLRATGLTSQRVAYALFSDADNQTTVTADPFCSGSTSIKFHATTTGTVIKCVKVDAAPGFTISSVTGINLADWTASSVTTTSVNISSSNNLNTTLDFTINFSIVPAGTGPFTFKSASGNNCPGNTTGGNEVNVNKITTAVVTTTNACVGGGNITFSQTGGGAGSWAVTGGGNINSSTGIFSPTTSGCFTASYTTTNGNCSGTANFIVFPGAPAAPTLNSGCGPIVVTPPPTISGFIIQYSFDDGATWGSNTPPTADNCNGYKIRTRYVTSANCGSISANTASTNPNCAASPATPRVLDTQAPTFTTAAGSLNRSVECSDAAGLTAAQALAPTATDNCGSVTYTKTSGTFVAGACGATGTYTNTWVAKDACLNTSPEFTQVITITDVTAPTFTRPADVTLFKDAACAVNDLPTGAAGDVTNEADNCSTGLNATFSDVVAQNCEGTYTITRTWSLVDKCGNAAANQVQTITVRDNIAPNWTILPGTLNRTLSCGNASDLAAAQALVPTAADNCSSVIIYPKTSGAFVTDGGGGGSYTNTFVAIDACGNTSTVFTQVITILAVSIDASASSAPIQKGTSSSTLKAEVTQGGADAPGVTVTFIVTNSNDVVMPLGATNQAITMNDGVATLPINTGTWAVDVYKVTAVAGNGCAESIAYLAVYDPSGGFVTGGGWFMSPKGALITNPEVTGKANFGFVSKYKKGSSIPEGNTEFQFHAGNLNFSSNSYSLGSLVVAGSRAIYKGTGTINGAGNYGFMVSAIDGQVNGGGNIDKFRIKIWNKDAADAIVYDNNILLDENDPPTTTLGGGSIVIHEAKGGNTNNVITTRTTTSISDDLVADESKPFKVNIYPNPSTTNFKIEVESETDELITIRVYDILGKLVSVNNKVTRNSVVATGEKLKGGTYFAEIIQGKNRKLVKLIKLN